MKRLTTLLLSLSLFVSCNKTHVDQDGNPFSSVIIGEQEWMAENLNASTFLNGDRIPQAASGEDWEKAGEEGSPAWCYFNNSSGIEEMSMPK